MIRSESYLADSQQVQIDRYLPYWLDAHSCGSWAVRPNRSRLSYRNSSLAVWDTIAQRLAFSLSPAQLADRWNANAACDPFLSTPALEKLFGPSPDCFRIGWLG